MPRRLVLALGLWCAVVGGACVGEDGTKRTPFDPSRTTSLAFDVAPRSQAILPGQSATYTVTVSSKQNINARVTLSASSVPGATITFNPQTLPDTGTRSTMTVQTSPTTVPQQAQIAVTATEEGANSTVALADLTIGTGSSTPDFTVVANPVTFSINQTTPQLVVATISSLNDFTGDVTLGFVSPTSSVYADGLSPPFRLVRGEKHDTGFSVYYRSGSATSPVIATLTATSGGVTRTQRLTITVPGATAPTPGSITSTR